MTESLRAGAQVLRDVRLYLVCDAAPGRKDAAAERDLESLLRRALEGGVDAIQLRDKALDDRGLIDASTTFRRLASELGVPFLLNDRPDLVAAAGADGVHVGQDDVPVSTARELAGADAIIGLSTHSVDQLTAACEAEDGSRPDYVSVGPVWPTPTKDGRTATGLEYVRVAAEQASLPWFAIGGIDETNVNEVTAAGASRIVVVRAIRDAPNVEAAARALRGLLRTESDLERVIDSPVSARTGSSEGKGS